MADRHDSPDNVEGMAFQLLLQKVTGVEQAIQSMVPLLKKIIDHLEAQGKQEDVPVATYAHLYPELQEGEASETETAGEVIDVTPTPQAAVAAPRRFWRWFTKDA